MIQPAARLRQCVVLVGGMGTRLGAETATLPKPVVAVGDRPFLAWLLRELSRYGFTEVLLLAGHLSEVLRAEMVGIERRLPRPMRIVICEEPGPAGTGGALRQAGELLDERFLLCNGDSLLDCNLAPLLAAAAADDDTVVGRLLLREVADTARYGVASTEGDRVTAFGDGATARPGSIYAGIGVFRRRVLDHLGAMCSLEREAMPLLAAAGLLRAQAGSGYFIDIGVPCDLARARAELPVRLQRPALLLDRDGVVNVDHGYVGSVERFAFTHTARAAIAHATDAGWHVFIVTNQSGIARGLYDEPAMHALHDWMLDQVLLSGGTIDDIRHCPFHPEGSVAAYARDSDWRKPRPGMLLDLIRCWELAPSHCVMVGDQDSDVAAARAAGIAGHLFPGGDLAAFVAPLLADPRT